SPLVVEADILVRSMGPISEKICLFPLENSKFSNSLPGCYQFLVFSELSVVGFFQSCFPMYYSMDCYFRQRWKDNRLAFNVSLANVSLNIKMLERIWSPDTIFLNGGRSYVHMITTPNKFFRINKDGSILYSQRLTIKASCPMQLGNFPLDSQQCPLYIGSFAYSKQDVLYEWRYGNAKAVEIHSDMTLPQFDLVRIPALNGSQLFKGAVHSILTVHFYLRRHMGYFLIQVYVPCCLLVVLSWVSFWINREATSDRIALGTTTVLTMTFLGLDTRSDLPRVSYSTALDVYVAMCFVFVVATIIQFATVHYFTKHGSGEDEIPMSDTDDEDNKEEDTPLDARKANGRTVSVRVRVMGTLNKLSCFRIFVNCIMGTKNYEFNRRTYKKVGLNSVSKIDRVSRILFPMAFVTFNIGYWALYLGQDEEVVFHL
ncbi:hypothetical protein ScPMuIL_011584, partial [Solemya velum]